MFQKSKTIEFDWCYVKGSGNNTENTRWSSRRRKNLFSIEMVLPGRKRLCTQSAYRKPKVKIAFRFLLVKQLGTHDQYQILQVGLQAHHLQEIKEEKEPSPLYRPMWVSKTGFRSKSDAKGPFYIWIAKDALRPENMETTFTHIGFGCECSWLLLRLLPGTFDLRVTLWIDRCAQCCCLEWFSCCSF